MENISSVEIEDSISETELTQERAQKILTERGFVRKRGLFGMAYDPIKTDEGKALYIKNLKKLGDLLKKIYAEYDKNTLLLLAKSSFVVYRPNLLDKNITVVEFTFYIEPKKESEIDLFL